MALQIQHLPIPNPIHLQQAQHQFDQSSVVTAQLAMTINQHAASLARSFAVIHELFMLVDPPLQADVNVIKQGLCRAQTMMGGLLHAMYQLSQRVLMDAELNRQGLLAPGSVPFVLDSHIAGIRSVQSSFFEQQRLTQILMNRYSNLFHRMDDQFIDG